MNKHRLLVHNGVRKTSSSRNASYVSLKRQPFRPWWLLAWLMVIVMVLGGISRLVGFLVL